MAKQVMRVKAESGVYYAIYETTAEKGELIYELHRDDNEGNGEPLCYGYKKHEMVSICLHLGVFIEWQNPDKNLF